ncbi:aconitate hydratase AcnA [Suttonella ornithocola]|uniref:Aconitate hydratase n=1 Tax=Suttonella ornithocola TaxID=279832 RepID=A0A380MSG0_9GAMM|nr:aconitate hydratase AcnA [Suttonella ornithocola]SUO95495.1 Aconitate hydratase 1 [Suttonella ornithocola]
MTNPNATEKLSVNGKNYTYYPLKSVVAPEHLGKLPYSIKILLENLLRTTDGESVTEEDVKALATWTPTSLDEKEIAFSPSRVILQDFTGVPCVVDLAAMRDAMVKLGGNPDKINPQVPVDLVIDHSVMVDYFGTTDALEKNAELEFERNHERYQFLRWGQKAFDRFRVVPPDTGIVHQVNLEYLAQVVFQNEENGETVVYPDSLVGTDSHTTMINGLGVLGWGVGGIEAEAAMLGQPITMLVPDVVGFELTGKLQPGVTATDLVLTVTQMLRQLGVVGKFVEFYGDGLADLPLADRATIANMAPEYGATCGIFPIDEETLNYMRLSGRSEELIALTQEYAKAQGMWRNPGDRPTYTETLTLDMGTVVPSVAGPKRPQDRIELSNLSATVNDLLPKERKSVEVTLDGETFTLEDGAVVINAITSCTNTSNPSVLLAAGLVAKKAVEKGLKRKPWCKTSLAPGSQVVTEYLEKAGLTQYLNQIGFDVVGYGCTTCIGNSGPLPDAIGDAIDANDLTVASVLSGNRNFEGRVHAKVKMNFLASPPLVVAYSLLGTVTKDITKEPIGQNEQGEDIYLKDIWPTPEEVQSQLSAIQRDMYVKGYSDVFKGSEMWQNIEVTESESYDWNDESTYIKNPPYFDGMGKEAPANLPEIKGARVLARLGDSITTDHISPAGSFKPETPAGQYLISRGVESKDFNSYGSRRGNDDVMVRGTFANIRLRNELAPGTEGGFTTNFLNNEVETIYDASMAYQKENIPLIVLAGKEYGTGSSRDWAAKGTILLGVKAVIAESFERIHRSNLVGMGVLPLQFKDGDTCDSLGLKGDETFDFAPLSKGMKTIEVTATSPNGDKKTFEVKVRIDTPKEWAYYQNGGILQYVLRQLDKAA